MSTEEINLTLAEIGDDTRFDELFNDWQVKTVLAQHTIDEAALRTICKIWFQRGIERGTLWAEAEMTRELKAEIERLRLLVRDDEDGEPRDREPIPCCRCGKPTTWDPTYNDLCYRCIRAESE